MSDATPPASTERSQLLLLLPTERLEDIFRHLLPPFDAPESEDRTTRLDAFLALMCTCRTLHAIGRRILYEKPCVRHHFQGHTGLAAFDHIKRRHIRNGANLLQTLVSNRLLAECVHDLTDLPFFVNAYSLPGFGPFAERDMGPGWALQRYLLQPCSKLRRVSVTIYGPQQARETAVVLTALPQLDFLQVGVSDHELEHFDTDTERALLRVFLEHFRLARQQRIRNGTSVTGDAAPSRLGTLVLSPSFDSAFWSMLCPVKLVDLVQAVTRGLRLGFGCLYSFHSVAPFLPDFTAQTNAGRLEELSLSYRALALIDGDTMTRALNGNRLTRFSLEGPAPRDHAILELEEYSDEITKRGLDSLPDTFLRAFPALVSLTVSHNPGLTIRKLEILVASSPNLECLDFPGCRWHVNSPSPPSRTITTADLADFETRLIGALSRFERLRSGDLGYMPIKEADRNDSSMAKLAAWACTRKVRVIWSGCA